MDTLRVDYLGDIILVDEAQDVPEGLIVLALGIVPAHRVHPDRLVVVLAAHVPWEYRQKGWIRDLGFLANSGRKLYEFM